MLLNASQMAWNEQGQHSERDIPDPSRGSRILAASFLDDKDEHFNTEGGAYPQMSTILNGIATSHQEGNASAGSGRPGFFENAQKVQLKNSTMIDIGTLNIRDNDTRTTLPWLEEHAMRGAEFDSSARDPPPRCHPGTRTAIIQRAQGWLNDPHREKKLLWLHGPAGVGKSAIIQTLAETESHRLGSSLFFSRPNRRNEPTKVFPTIAYQLAVRDPSYKAYIAELMALDPGSLDKAISEQFRRLFIEPFVKRNIRSSSGVWLIVLDGLDECGGVQGEHQTRPAPGRHSGDYQCKIVELISRFVLDYPSVPLVWIIASRPEPHLKAAFSQDIIVQSFWEEDIPVDSNEACRDVEKYLRNEFDVVRRKYPDHVSSETWPSNEEFLKIARAASGLFAFASVIILFIGDPWVANPIDQLDCVLSVIDKLDISRHQENPLAALDAIYTEILHRIPPNTWTITRQLIATSIFFGGRPGNLWSLCNVFGVTKGVAVTALRHLHSVIIIPRNDKIEKLYPEFYHASFPDYLKDRSRSHEYAVDAEAMQEVSNELTRGSFRILQNTIVTPGEHELDKAFLSWACNEENPSSLIQRAGVLCHGFLLGTFQDNIYRFRHCLSEIRIPASDALLIAEKLDLRLVTYAPAYARAHVIFEWLGRLVNHFREELVQKGILSYVALGTLDIGKLDYNRARYAIRPFRENPENYPYPSPDLVRRWVKLSPSMEVAVYGTGSRRCAIFQITEVVNREQRIYTCVLPGV